MLRRFFIFLVWLVDRPLCSVQWIVIDVIEITIIIIVVILGVSLTVIVGIDAVIGVKWQIVDRIRNAIAVRVLVVSVRQTLLHNRQQAAEEVGAVIRITRPATTDSDVKNEKERFLEGIKIRRIRKLVAVERNVVHQPSYALR